MLSEWLPLVPVPVIKERKMNVMFRLLLISFCCTAAAQHVNSLSKNPRKESSQVSLIGCLSGPNHEGVYVLETGSDIVDVVACLS